jgi:hypothetical protein
MTRYYFDLLANDELFCDEDGTDVCDGYAAQEYGRRIAREILQGAELSKRHWRLRIYDRHERRSPVAELLFASADPTLDHLAPQLRRSIENVCRRHAELMESGAELKMTIYQTRALLAWHGGKPFLAATGGRRLVSMPGSSELPTDFTALSDIEDRIPAGESGGAPIFGGKCRTRRTSSATQVILLRLGFRLAKNGVEFADPSMPLPRFRGGMRETCRLGR